MKRRNAAVSAVVSTVILSSALIVIVTVAFYAANNAINSQIESAQFDQAKNVLVSLANVVKTVLLNPGSSGYVRASFSNSLPQFEKTSENLTLTITCGGGTYNISQNIIKIKGGPIVGVLTPTDILGEDTLLLKNTSGSLGRVSVFQSNGAWVSLDYTRARCVYIGSSSYYNGTGYENFNVVEITMVNLTFGTFEPDAQAIITVQNLGMHPPRGWLQVPMEVSDNSTIQVSLSDGESTGPQTFANLITEQGGKPGKQVLINFVIVDIEVSVLKGG